MPKKITKKKQKSLARTAKKKALSEWSQKVRERDGCCVICGKTEHLNAHHILPKENYNNLMLDVVNGITLCVKHHKFSKFSAHKNPVWFAVFLQKNKLEQWKWCVDHMGDDQDLPCGGAVPASSLASSGDS